MCSIGLLYPSVWCSLQHIDIVGSNINSEVDDSTLDLANLSAQLDVLRSGDGKVVRTAQIFQHQGWNLFFREGKSRTNQSTTVGLTPDCGILKLALRRTFRTIPNNCKTDDRIHISIEIKNLAVLENQKSPESISRQLRIKFRVIEITKHKKVHRVINSATHRCLTRIKTSLEYFLISFGPRKRIIVAISCSLNQVAMSKIIKNDFGW